MRDAYDQTPRPGNGTLRSHRCDIKFARAADRGQRSNQIYILSMQMKQDMP